MNKRLVWNFEISNERPLDFLSLTQEEPELQRFEARYFWGENEPILLQGLDDTFLNLALFDSKERRDLYYLIPDYHYNIKQRRDELFYKPLLKQTKTCQGFGKKINLSASSTLDILPGIPAISKDKLQQLIQSRGQKIYVEKTALICKFTTWPTIKFELARLKIGKKIYFSVCIEGRSQRLVTLISEHVLSKSHTDDYVHFLKETNKHV